VKILRRHHGFTTNSSASSEWIPPPTPLKDRSDETVGTPKTAGGDAPLTTGRIEGGGSATPTSLRDGQQAATGAAQRHERPSPLVDNVLVVRKLREGDDDQAP